MKPSINQTRATEAVAEIINDLRDRGGLGEQWELIDEEIQSEIFDVWKKIVLDQMNRGW